MFLRNLLKMRMDLRHIGQYAFVDRAYKLSKQLIASRLIEKVKAGFNLSQKQFEFRRE